MLGGLFEDTIRIVKRWKPKKFSNEKEYTNDLVDFLRYEFKGNHNSFEIGIQRRISVTKEDGRGLCDIAINKKIGIELKKDLKSKSEINRLVGQTVGYKKDYQDVIIVLVGDTKEDALELLKDDISELRQNDIGFGLNQEPRIKVIDKALRTKNRKKTYSPYNFGF